MKENYEIPNPENLDEKDVQPTEQTLDITERTMPDKENRDTTEETQELTEDSQVSSETTIEQPAESAVQEQTTPVEKKQQTVTETPPPETPEEVAGTPAEKKITEETMPDKENRDTTEETQELTEDSQVSSETTIEQPAESAVQEQTTPVEKKQQTVRETPSSETPEEVVGTPVEKKDTVQPEQLDSLTKEEIIARLKELINALTLETPRQEVEKLKQAYYHIRKKEKEEEKEAVQPVDSQYPDSKEGEENKEAAPVELQTDETDELFKNLLKQIKDKKVSLLEQQELVRENNYQIKLIIVEELKQLGESQDDFGRLFNEFKNLQQRWKEITDIPQSKANELWKNYHYFSERLYDLIKINIEMRDYDFKKNLELKTALCEAAEKLADEKDVISAFHQLQKLHEEWREIGPVAKEIREEIWQRFKNASSVVNKHHHEHFEKLKASEQENLERKQEICRTIEEIDLTVLKTFKEWEQAGEKIIELQQVWRTIGFAPKKENTAIFARFRAACDNFFSKKSEFTKQVRTELDNNLARKKSLCEKAEALKNSTDWKETTEKLIALQKEWKTIGSVSRKESDAVWKRFVSACDHFFEQKNKNFSSQRSEEQENLKQKHALIEEVRSFDPASVESPIEQIRDFISRFNQIGHVPFKEKDKVYKAFHDLIDEFFNKLKVDKSERRIANYRNSISEMAGNAPKGKILNERERLMRNYERLRSDLQTYENNIGFLSVSSKGGNSLVKEMERQVEKLKEEMELIVKKIETIDESLES